MQKEQTRLFRTITDKSKAKHSFINPVVHAVISTVNGSGGYMHKGFQTFDPLPNIETKYSKLKHLADKSRGQKKSMTIFIFQKSAGIK